MQELIEQMEQIEQNAKNINDAELLMAMNKKYRDLEEKLDQLTTNINVIYKEV